MNEMALRLLTSAQVALLMGLLQLSEIVAVANGAADGCSEIGGSSSSSSCMPISPYATSPRGVPKEDQDLIVAYHNYFRRQQPDAADMQLMVWDEELASRAQQWSDNCEYGFDPVSEISKKYSFGQNIGYYSSSPSWNATVRSWYTGGASNFVYGSDTLNFGKIGQFLQIIWGSSAKIGCGSTTCTNMRAKYFVCNYSPAGNDYDRISRPYTKGTTCSACPDHCSQGLCDCGGLVCKNGGTLNLNTCSCTCEQPFTGRPDCNLKCDDAQDGYYCQFWNKDDCQAYYNVPLECPFMCGLCPDLSDTTDTTTRQNDLGSTSKSLQNGAATPELSYSTAPLTLPSEPANSVTLPSDTTVRVSSRSVDLSSTSSAQIVSLSKSDSTTSSAPATKCPPGYAPPHSACLEISSFAVSPKGISQADKDLIVAVHNDLRRLQNASDMQLMVWDDEAALIAQKWSDNCVYGHDAKRDFADGTAVGQNVAYGFRSWSETIEKWYEEIADFEYGNSNFNFYDIGHYTQIVWNATSRIGCGLTTCTNLKAKFYVCNYAPAGNFYNQVATPYTQGTPCEACPAHCHLGLCDCGGLTCKHGGTLHLKTCTCACQRPYTGEPDCTLECAGVEDQAWCQYWNASFCDMYYNVPLDCPYMCGVCLQASETVETTPFSVPLEYTDAAIRTTSQYRATTVDDSLLSHPTPDVAVAAEELPQTSASSEGMTARDKDAIVVLHNSLRRKASATDMQLMVWDDELATEALSVAKDCQFEIEAHSKHFIPGKYAYEQLIAVGTYSWNDTIYHWYNAERALIQDGTWSSSTDNARRVQILRSSTAKIGCGMSQCQQEEQTLFVCNYATWSDQTPKPYTDGVPCSACSEHCNSGLCDCNGLVCKNGGSLNVSSCQCSCKSPYTVTPDCGVPCSAAEDPWYCGEYWPPVYCTMYDNVPFYCSKMCAVCPASGSGEPHRPLLRRSACARCPGKCVSGSCDCSGVFCRNGGVLDPTTCTCACPIPFRGLPDCSLNCTGLADAWYCGSVWPSTYCNIYSNVKSFCPVMCGFCPGANDIAPDAVRKRK